MDVIDFKILRAIEDLKTPYPKAERIVDMLNIDAEELGARLGVLEMDGYIKTKSETGIMAESLPNGVTAAGLTNQGRRKLIGERW